MSNKVQARESKDITVQFDPECCINAGNCACCLPCIVDPHEKGLLIHPDEASAEELSALVRSCPSGALAFAENDEVGKEAVPKRNKITVQADGSHIEASFADDGRCPVAGVECRIAKGSLNIRTLPDGPLLLQGPYEIHDAVGRVVARGTKAALCRCGASGNKPYCEGSHVAVDFKSED